MMTNNPILHELHTIRERLLAEAGGTLDGLVDRLQATEQNSDRPRFQSRRTRIDTEATDCAVHDGDSAPSTR